MNPTITRLNEARSERSALLTRMAVIDRDLALGRAEYLAGSGGGQSFPERAALSAERATLNVRRLELTELIASLKDAAKEARAGTLVRLLCAELETRGMQEVIEDCRRRASATDPVVD